MFIALNDLSDKVNHNVKFARLVRIAVMRICLFAWAIGKHEDLLSR